MTVTPSEAKPSWPGWDDVIKTHWQMCEQAAGEGAFVEYMNSLIKPRRWAPEVARNIAMRLRGADSLDGNYPYALSLSDIIVTLNGCPGSRVRDNWTGTKVTETQLGRWMRDAGVTLWYPTRQLNGTYTASMAARGPAVTISKVLARVRAAADELENAKLDPSEVASCLDASARRQLGAFANDVLNRVSHVSQLLKENS